MSFTMVSNSILESGLDPYALAVFTAVKKHFPVMRPGIRRIASIAGCSHVTVIRRLRVLATLGFLQVKKGKRGQWSEYTISESHLTQAEVKAQRQSSWAGLSHLARIFTRSAKVVNVSKPAHAKVVNGVDPNNTNTGKQDASDGGFRSASAFFKENPGYGNWIKGPLAV